MNDDRLSTLLRLQSVDLAERGAFCPGDREVAAYFDGKLPEPDHERLERHLHACAYCLARVGVLGRLDSDGNQRPVPESVLATAKQIRSRSARSGLRRSGAWAAVAVLVLAVFSAVIFDRGPVQQSGNGASIETPGAESLRALRSSGAADSRFGIEVRMPDGPLSAGSTIRWSGAANPLRYELFVLSAAGDVVWTEQLDASEWVFSRAAGLDAGTDYYLRVDAVLRDGRILSSPHVPLRTSEQL